jgi:hypothetical protein
VSSEEPQWLAVKAEDVDAVATWLVQTVLSDFGEGEPWRKLCIIRDGVLQIDFSFGDSDRLTIDFSPLLAPDKASLGLKQAYCER